MKPVSVIDYETEPAGNRPHHNPPKPVGVSIYEIGKEPTYYAWGHPTGNNITLPKIKMVLKSLYKRTVPIFHNGKFDLEVGEKWLDLPLVLPNGWHDTMLLAFLYNPRFPNMKLKPLADLLLDMPPEERDELQEWIFANIPGAKKAKTKWYEHICNAPAALVGKYAIGDVVRTYKLFQLFIQYVLEKMPEQYEIEKRVVIKAIEMEREGITIDVKQLKPDLEQAKTQLNKHQMSLIKLVGDINYNSPKQIIEAFDKKKLVKKWQYTEKGNPKTGIDSLIEVCSNKQVVHHLDMFSKYTKIIGTYMQPWLDSALENNGKFFPWFNTIKGDNDKGTYTGRFSSNFQQVPRKPLEDYKELPFLRNYIVPDRTTHILYNRDFSQQELRILAHFEDGPLLEAYLADPRIDIHDKIKTLIESNQGIITERTLVKICNFLMVYGGGVDALAKNAKIPEEKASNIMKAHRAALPGVAELKAELRRLARLDKTFKTAGGRIYTFEDGFEYVALNTLIQGSAADHTKRALLNIDDMLKDKYPNARLMLTVHDEFMITGPKNKKLMKDFKEAMEYDKLFDVPMLSDGKIGDRWGNMTKLAKGL